MPYLRYRLWVNLAEDGEVLGANADTLDPDGEVVARWGVVPFSTTGAGILQELLDACPTQGVLFG